MYLFAVNDKQSLECVIAAHLKIVQFCEFKKLPNLSCILVGHKCDVKNRQVLNKN